MIYFIIMFCFLGDVISLVPQSYYRIEDADTHFLEFTRTFNKVYSSEDERKERLEIFKINLGTINRRNNGSDAVVFGINKFSDLTEEEYLSMLTVTIPEDENPCENVISDGYALGDAPEEWDWRTKNVVTKVKNQGRCGSCWAFSTTANIESQYAMKYNQLEDFSVQQLLDCDKTDDGCNGGLMNSALLYLKEVGGIMTGQDYLYQAKVGTCRFNKSKIKAKVTGCTQYFFKNEDELKETLYKVGPLAVVVDATDWQMYTNGVLLNCEQGKINHAVLLVGYGTENGIPYWLIKNSYGEDFGESGYIKSREM